MSDKLLEAIGGISEQFIAECDDYISQRKASHRRRKLTRVTALCAAVIAGAALLTGAVYSIFRVSFRNTARLFTTSSRSECRYSSPPGA